VGVGWKLEGRSVSVCDIVSVCDMWGVLVCDCV